MAAVRFHTPRVLQCLRRLLRRSGGPATGGTWPSLASWATLRALRRPRRALWRLGGPLCGTWPSLASWALPFPIGMADAARLLRCLRFSAWLWGSALPGPGPGSLTGIQTARRTLKGRGLSIAT